MATKKQKQTPQIVRCYGAGVFYAIVENREGKEAVLRNARRLWYWDGAATLSELATSGTKKPKDCRFPTTVDRITVTDVIEVIDTTPEARASIEATPVWSA